MTLNYDQVMAIGPMEARQALTVRDTMIYALGVGAGLDAPTDPEELRFVYEDGLQSLPTMAVVLAYPGFWAREEKYGIEWRRIVHGEQSLELHRALPVEGMIRGVTTIDDVFDKGPDKGAVVYTTKRLYEDSTGDLLATARQSSFLRGDGGFGGRSEGAPVPHAVPDRAPDKVLTMQTRPEQALIYRLSGDYNPMHAHPEAARKAGFPLPLLHGLATYGIVGRAILREFCANRPERLKRFDVRFSKPVFPGERLDIDVWHEGPGRAALRARVAERDVVVLQNCYVEYAT